MGGPSSEHGVSLDTGEEIMKNLDKNKYELFPVIISKSGGWLLPENSATLLKKPDVATKAAMLREKTALHKFRREKPDVAFIAMHGKYGEDGTIQGLLEGIGIPYTGSGVLASALGMDKPRSCAIFNEAGLLVPEYEVITKDDLRNSHLLTKIIKTLSWPIVVKPANQGSSVGVNIARNKKELRSGIREAFRHSPRVILQKFIKGREITCAVLEDEKGKLVTLPPIEILPKAGRFYDYRSKYETGGSEHVIPPPGVSDKTLQEIKSAASTAHAALGCSDMSRSDFILGNDKKLYILEINTIPGMTSTSLLPDAARVTGIGFSQLLDIIINSALRKSGRRYDGAKG